MRKRPKFRTERLTEMSLALYVLAKKELRLSKLDPADNDSTARPELLLVTISKNLAKRSPNVRDLHSDWCLSDRHEAQAGNLDFVGTFGLKNGCS